jgi:hypothetical protein
MAGKITMFCQVFDSIKLFNSRWGYLIIYQYFTGF